MLFNEAISLIDKSAIDRTQPTVWADLGCGSGLFTRALSALLASGSSITAVDNLPLHPRIRSENTTISINYENADFEHDLLNITGLNGILMANSLHYVANKKGLLNKLEAHLQPDATYIIVEYDTMIPNEWVPYPVDKLHLRALFADAGFLHCEQVGSRPSLYGQGDMYACHFQRR